MLVAVAFVMTGLASFTSPWALLALLAAPLVIRPMQAVVGRATGRGLIPALAGTGQFQLGVVGAARRRSRPRARLTGPSVRPAPPFDAPGRWR